MTEKEIKQLRKQVNDQKHEIGRLIDINNKLKQDNEQLKNALKELQAIGDYQEHRIRELDNENRNIQNTIREAMENERTALGKSVLKQLLESLE